MRSRIAAGLLAALLATLPAFAHDMTHMQPPQAVQQPAAVIPDIPVLDQDGKRLNFYSDLVRRKTVAIDFIFTPCRSFCSMLPANCRTVQAQLAARVGKDVALISISIDPANDTPARLKEFSAQFEPRPGWTFVTGARPDDEKLPD